ncbi:hypothetical protein E2562_011035 [Oryza meyeriana var. granulata]|uniref:Uncharacterized protein n=1 Tax=Oryza meyeriana var. granulata TaxID=110450 RepID=A0A6G1EWB9_9ORYZ|nr:hypothetical protein E2562_011035 [Oryza meyeriana var. granulata]
MVNGGGLRGGSTVGRGRDGRGVSATGRGRDGSATGRGHDGGAVRDPTAARSSQAARRPDNRPQQPGGKTTRCALHSRPQQADSGN